MVGGSPLGVSNSNQRRTPARGSELSMSAISDRLARLRATLEAAGLDALLIGNAANRRWISGFSGSAGWALISTDRALLSTDSRYWEQVERQCPEFELHRQEPPLTGWLPSLVGGQGRKKIGFEADHLAVSLHKQMRAAIAKMAAPERPGLVQTEALVEELRAVKDAEELASIKRAVLLGDETFTAVADRVEPGWTESRLAWEIEKYAREHGAEAMSFATIVGGGPWGAMPHAYPRDVSIAAGHPVVIDMGVVVDGYCSDLTRTIVLGQPDDRFREIYEIVLTAQETAESTIEAGMTGSEVHMLAHNVIAEAGYGEQFGHGLGHGVGLEIHERPRIGKTAEDVIQDGMVITVEPGVYLPGWGGVRIEDMGVIENGTYRNLTTAAKLRLIDSDEPAFSRPTAQEFTRTEHDA